MLRENHNKKINVSQLHNRRVLDTHSIRQFPLHFPYRASSCAITFQLESTIDTEISLLLSKRLVHNLATYLSLVPSPKSRSAYIFNPPCVLLAQRLNNFTLTWLCRVIHTPRSRPSAQECTVSMWGSLLQRYVIDRALAAVFFLFIFHCLYFHLYS